MTTNDGGGSWLVARELFERGDPAFVDELRQVTAAARLAQFAATWYADPRPAARRALIDYLGRPLNIYGHEGLVKRLFKLAEKAGDDEVMVRFLVLFDRSVRRVRRMRNKGVSHWMKDPDEADALRARLEAEGFTVSSWSNLGRVSLWAHRREEAIITRRRTTMPRARGWDTRNPRTGAKMRYTDLSSIFGREARDLTRADPIPEPMRKRLERYTLFSVHTRYYLRRRAWRYFRTLGRDHPGRYVPAAALALALYEDADVADGLALIDNWGMIHILFHHSPVLDAGANAWFPARGRSLAELEPAPSFAPLWRDSPGTLVDLLLKARCRAVRLWAVRMVQSDPGHYLGSQGLDTLFRLLASEVANVSRLAADWLRQAPGLANVKVEDWLALLDTTNPDVLEVVCEMIAVHLRAERVPYAEAARLAASRPLPIARLGLAWLQVKEPAGAEDYRALLGLAEAEADSLRPEIVRWARGVLEQALGFEPGWVLDFLDSRHADVRAEGWAWFLADRRAREDVTLWRRLFESPHDDVRLALVAELERRTGHGGAPADSDGRALAAGALDPETVRYLWAAVLLNVHRGGRSKPVVVRQLSRRLSARPDEAGVLLPLLGVSLRSVRGPEWRAGLAAVVQLVADHPETEPLVQQAFPELQLQ